MPLRVCICTRYDMKSKWSLDVLTTYLKLYLLAAVPRCSYTCKKPSHSPSEPFPKSDAIILSPHYPRRKKGSFLHASKEFHVPQKYKGSLTLIIYRREYLLLGRWEFNYQGSGTRTWIPPLQVSRPSSRNMSDNT